MSYILEALKKSEQDRRAQINASSPSPMEVRYSETRTGKWRAGALFVVVVIAVGSGYFWYDQRDRVQRNSKSSAGSTAVVIPDKAEALHPGKARTGEAPTPTAPNPKPQVVGSSYESLPFVWELPSELKANFANIKVTIHVYGAGKDPHMIYINDRQYRSGERIREGARVERITPEGVVLSTKGVYFKLPRPR